MNRARVVRKEKGRTSSAMLVYIVGFTKGGKREVSFEEASAWAQSQGCTYFEVNLQLRTNVKEVVASLARELREREPAVAKDQKRKYFKVTIAKYLDPENKCALITCLLFCWLVLLNVTSIYLLFTSIIQTSSILQEIGLYLISILLMIFLMLVLCAVINKSNNDPAIFIISGLALTAFGLLMPLYSFVIAVFTEDGGSRALFIVALEIGNIILSPLLVILLFLVRTHFEAALAPIFGDTI